MNKRIAVYAGTRNVYENMTVAAKSLLNHTQMDCVWFFIEDDTFPEQLPEVIRTKNIRGQKWFTEGGPNYNTAWTYMSLIRLALPEILKEESKCLWLDTDTIVEKDIGELFEKDLTGYYAGMVEEPIRSKYPFRYYNSGVCLMNLDRLRDGTYMKMIDLVNREAYTAPDQDMINLFCQGEILKLPPEWNMAEHITEHADDPYIRHYAGCLRPRIEQAYNKYMNMDWRDCNASESE